MVVSIDGFDCMYVQMEVGMAIRKLAGVSQLGHIASKEDDASFVLVPSGNNQHVKVRVDVELFLFACSLFLCASPAGVVSPAGGLGAVQHKLSTQGCGVYLPQLMFLYSIW